MGYNYEAGKNAFNNLSDDEKRKFLSSDDPVVPQFVQDYEKENGALDPSLYNKERVQQPQNQTFSDTQTWGNQTQNQASNFSQPVKYGLDKQFDPSEQLDQSKFTNPNAQVRVQEGNARQTGKPDYEVESEARDREIINNLNSYKVSNPEFFRDRETFNRAFDYHGRKSDRQRSVLDSVWKRIEDGNKISNYTTAESISEGIKNADITKDQLNLLKEQYPDLYKKRQDKEDELTKLRIANKTVPNDPMDSAELLLSLTDRLGIKAELPYKIHETYRENLDRYGVTRDTERLVNLQDKITNTYKEIADVEAKIRAQSAGASESLIQARIQKATTALYQNAQAYQQGYSAILQGRQQNLAIANGDVSALINQTQEDQRIFNNKLKSLGFSMEVASFETPEQKRQADLRYKEQAVLMENKLKSQLSDLSVKDPEQLRANLTNALSGYYKEYGNLIQRSQSQVVDDVLKYAKEKGISVAQALSENFIKPLQNKPEYRAMIAKSTGVQIGSEVVKVGDHYFYRKTNPDGSVSMSQYGEVNLSWGSNGLLNLSVQTAYQWPDYTPATPDRLYQALRQLKAQRDWAIGWQCASFVNDYLHDLGIGRLFASNIDAKKAVINSSIPEIGSVAVVDWRSNPNATEAQKKYGHVGIVTAINPDGSIVLKQSNKNGDEKIFTSSYRADQVVWYFNPTLRKEEATASMQWESWVYDKNLIDYFTKDASKLDGTDRKAIANAGYDQNTFLTQKRAYQESVAKEITNTEIDLLKDLYEMKNVWSWTYKQASLWIKIPMTDSANFSASYNNFISNSALKHLIDAKARWATFGALSDKELAFIQNASTRLKIWVTKEKFDEILNTVIRELEGRIRDRGGDLTSIWYYEEPKQPNNPNWFKLNGFKQYENQNNSVSYWEVLDL